MKKIMGLITVAFVLMTTLAHAFLPSGSSEFYYELGGAEPITGAIFDGPPSANLQLNWKAGLNCSGNKNFEFDFSKSIESAFNVQGISSISTGRIKGAFKSAITSIGSMGFEGAANIAASVVLKKLNPQLYDTIQGGIAKVEEMISMAENACELVKEQITQDGGLLDKMHESAQQHGWLDLLNPPTDPNAGPNTPPVTADIIEESQKIKKESSNKGVKSFGGIERGNDDDNPLQINKEATLSGYNMIQGRTSTDTSVPSVSGTQPPILKLFPTPASAESFAQDVIGERALTTCDTCEQVKTVPGRGLNYVYEQETAQYRDNFQKILDGTWEPTVENLKKISAEPLVYVTPKMVEMMKRDPDGPYVAARMASEAGLIVTMQKALMLKRMLYTAKREPNAEASGFLKEGVDEAIVLLNEEIDMLKTELEINNMISSKTASRYMEHYKNKYQTDPSIYNQGEDIPRIENGGVRQ